MSSVIQVSRIYLIFNPVHFLVDSSDRIYMLKTFKGRVLFTPLIAINGYNIYLLFIVHRNLTIRRWQHPYKLLE